MKAYFAPSGNFAAGAGAAAAPRRAGPPAAAAGRGGVCWAGGGVLLDRRLLRVRDASHEHTPGKNVQR